MTQVMTDEDKVCIFQTPLICSAKHDKHQFRTGVETQIEDAKHQNQRI